MSSGNKWLKVGVRLRFSPTDFSSSQEAMALFYHAYRTTVLSHEALQSHLRWLTTSGFSIEDGPSNHLAFIRATTNLSLSEISQIMGGVEGGIREEDWKDIRGQLPRNDDPELRPMVYQQGGWEVLPWPVPLQPPPLPGGVEQLDQWITQRQVFANIHIPTFGLIDHDLQISIPLPSSWGQP